LNSIKAKILARFALVGCSTNSSTRGKKDILNQEDSSGTYQSRCHNLLPRKDSAIGQFNPMKEILTKVFLKFNLYQWHC